MIFFLFCLFPHNFVLLDTNTSRIYLQNIQNKFVGRNVVFSVRINDISVQGFQYKHIKISTKNKRTSDFIMLHSLLSDTTILLLGNTKVPVHILYLSFASSQKDTFRKFCISIPQLFFNYISGLNIERYCLCYFLGQNILLEYLQQ